MYFAEDSNTINFDIYKGLLDRYLQDQHSSEIRVLFEHVIKAAHELACGKIAQHSVDHTIYNLVTSLVDDNKTRTRAYFQNINPDNIGLTEFRTLSGILVSLATPH